jgi:fructoselysine 6-kinase
MSGTILAIGDNVVDCYVDQGIYYPGGNAVNVAVHGRRCGADTAYIGAVGTDAAGRTLVDALAAEDVDTTRLRVVDGANAYAVVRVIEGNRVFGAGGVGVSRFTLAEGDLEAASRARLVHTGECSMLEDQLPRLAAHARTLSFDFSERPWDYIDAYAPLVDVAIRSCPSTSRDEALAEARRLHAMGPRVVAVTLGAGGAVVVSAGVETWAPAPETHVVDTLGAGDAFIARFLTGLDGPEPLERLVGAATAYASAVCTQYGAFGYPTPLAETTSPLDPHTQGVDHR